MISCKGVVVCTAVWAACFSHAWAAEERDVTSLPIEQLLDIEVSTAATLVPAHLARGVDASFSIRNLFNRQYRDPATVEYFNSMNQRLDFIPQNNGRTLMARLDCTL